jgi:hypothetical protein
MRIREKKYRMKKLQFNGVNADNKYGFYAAKN